MNIEMRVCYECRSASPERVPGVLKSCPYCNAPWSESTSGTTETHGYEGGSSPPAP